MTDRVTNVAVLGSTGSIGCSTLDVIRGSEGLIRAVGLSAHSNTDLLIEQARSVRPRRVVVTDEETAGRSDFSALPAETELLRGPDALIRLVTDDEVGFCGQGQAASHKFSTPASLVYCIFRLYRPALYSPIASAWAGLSASCCRRSAQSVSSRAIL